MRRVFPTAVPRTTRGPVGATISADADPITSDHHSLMQGLDALWQDVSRKASPRSCSLLSILCKRAVS